MTDPEGTPWPTFAERDESGESTSEWLDGAIDFIRCQIIDDLVEHTACRERVAAARALREAADRWESGVSIREVAGTWAGDDAFPQTVDEWIEENRGEA